MRLFLDSISTSFMFIAGIIIVYLSVYGYNIITSLALLTVSVAFYWLMGKSARIDKKISGREGRNIMSNTAMAVGFMMVANFLGIFLFTVPVEGMVLTDVLLMAVLFAIVEEIFFRGALLDFFLWKLKKVPSAAIFLSAVVFAVFHFRVYGTNPSALYVMLAVGMILGFVAWKTKRLTPVLLAHIINNVWAVLGSAA